MTELREDFKNVLPDLFCVIVVGLADEPDGIRQLDVALRFLHLLYRRSINFFTDKNSWDAPTSTTYPSNANLPFKRQNSGGIIKLYQSRCFFIIYATIFDFYNHIFLHVLSSHFHLQPQAYHT